jgi:hypothetical protein
MMGSHIWKDIIKFTDNFEKKNDSLIFIFMIFILLKKTILSTIE